MYWIEYPRYQNLYIMKFTVSQSGNSVITRFSIQSTLVDGAVGVAVLLCEPGKAAKVAKALNNATEGEHYRIEQGNPGKITLLV